MKFAFMFNELSINSPNAFIGFRIVSENFLTSCAEINDLGLDSYSHFTDILGFE